MGQDETLCYFKKNRGWHKASETRVALGVCRQSISYSLKKLTKSGALECKKELIDGVYVNFYRIKR